MAAAPSIRLCWAEASSSAIVLSCRSRNFPRHRCVPEDAAPEPVSFRVFLDSVPTPPRVKSPFIRSSSIQGSGQQGEPLIKEDKEQNPYYTRLDGWAEGAGQVVGYHRIMSRKRLSEPVLPPPDSVETLPVAAPRTRGSQGSGNKRAKEDAPATQLLELAEQESFDPLPAEIRKWCLPILKSPYHHHFLSVICDRQPPDNLTDVCPMPRPGRRRSIW